ncbi:hypothetical protein GWI33_007517, partial [Rhynchophorus ferrugineus]
PTVIRNAGLGAGSTCARIGSISAPYINITAHIWQPLPLLIFGSLALIGGILSLVLPETLNKKLPETIEEGELFGQKTKKKLTEDTIETEILSSTISEKVEKNENDETRTSLLSDNPSPNEK